MTERQIALALNRHGNFVGYLRNSNKAKYKDVFCRYDDMLKSAKEYEQDVQNTKLVILELASVSPLLYKEFVKEVYGNKCFRHNLTIDSFIVLPEEDNIMATYKTVLKARKIVKLYIEFIELHKEILGNYNGNKI